MDPKNTPVVVYHSVDSEPENTADAISRVRLGFSFVFKNVRKSFTVADGYGNNADRLTTNSPIVPANRSRRHSGARTQPSSAVAYGDGLI